MGRKRNNILYQELKCSICGKSAIEDTHFYQKKMLCNKHYLQIYRHGIIIDDKPSTPIILKNKCDICGDLNSNRYTIWHSNDEFDGLELCGKHYTQIRKYHKFIDKIPSSKNLERKCCVCGSDNKVIYSRIYENMYCRKHYSQLHNMGEIKEKTIFDKNEFYIKNDIAYLILRDEKNNDVAEVKLDIEDLEDVIKYKWHLSSWGYAENHTKGLMQRYLLNEYDKSKIPDHINRDRLDNRRENLRIVDKSKNAVNTGLRCNNKSGVTGVNWFKPASLWRSYINYQGKRIELGYFKDINDAIIARLNAENKYYASMQPQLHLFKQYGVEVYEE